MQSFGDSEKPIGTSATQHQDLQSELEDVVALPPTKAPDNNNNNNHNNNNMGSDRGGENDLGAKNSKENCTEKDQEKDKTLAASTDSEESAIVPMNRLQFWTLSLAMALSILVVALDDCIVGTAIPRITDQFNSLDDVGWYGSGYLMPMACFQLTYGKLYKHLPGKWVLLSALAIFELGSIVCAAAPSSNALIVGRAIAGVGGSGIYSGVLIIISQAVPIRQRAIFTSSVGSIHGVAAVCGPILGGLLTDSYLTWRWCFWINVPLGVSVILIILFLFHPQPMPQDEKLASWHDWIRVLDPLGLLIFTASMLCLFLALQISGSSGWNSATPIALIVVFVVLLAGFGGVQVWLGENGTLPPRIALLRQVIFSSGYAFFIDSCYYVVAYFLPLWFQSVKLLSARDSGIRLIPVIACTIIFSLLSGIFVAKTGHFAPVIFLSAVLAATGCGLLTTMTPSSGAGAFIGFPALVGSGVGLGMQQGAVIVQNKLDKGDIPTAISAVTMFQILGSATMVSVAQNVFASSVYSQLHGIAPDLTRAGIFNTGATELVGLAGSGQHGIFLDAVNKALTLTFYVSTVGATMSGLSGLGLGFQKMET